MGKVLKQLLGNDHPLFLMNVARLERAAGNVGIDTALIGEITHKGFDVLRALRLDPKDTTGLELYNALNAAVRREDIDIEELLEASPYVVINLGAGPISCNLHDVIENTHHELPYEKRTLAHAQRQLRTELIRRYAEHERTHDEMVKELAREAKILLDDDEHHPNIYNRNTQNKERQVNTPNVDKPYVLAIGDIFTDAFVKLNDDEAKVHKDDDGTEWLSVKFGQKMPYDYVDIVSSVGPSPNAAVSFSRLGLRSGLMAFMGEDQVGQESLEYLADQRVDTTTIKPEPGAKSSYWYVLRYGADRTMLVKNEDYAYEWVEPEEVPEWIYLSQISPSAWGLHEKLLEYLERNPSVKLAFQPGTSHFRWGTEKLQDIYRRAHITIMNREEAMDVTGRGYDSIRELAEGLHELGPEIVVITDGPNGSYASYEGKVVTIPNYPDPAPPYERTGAGDAFASTIVAALAHGETMDKALTWAPINSAYVVQKLGAQKGLLLKRKLLDYLAHAPDYYKVSVHED